MHLWEILVTLFEWLFTLLDWLSNWRSSLCFWGGGLLAVLTEAGFHGTIPGHVLAGIVLVTGIVIGIRWECSH